MGEISGDILVTCDDENRRGGIKRIFVASRSTVTSFTAGALQDYTAVTMDATSDVWFEIQVMDEGASVAGESSKENGSSMVEYVVEATIPKLDKTKALQLQALFTSCKVVAIVETYISTGTYNQAFVIGYDEILGKDAALECAVGTTIEAELQGQNAYALTMTGKSAEQLREYVGTFTSNLGGTENAGS